MKHRAEIDGLRAVAVIPVVLFHAGFPAFHNGYVGVDIFFVISGYLIAGIIYRELTSGVFSLRNFYERRIRRIAPMLITVCLVCIPVAWVSMPPSDYLFFSKGLVSVVTFCSNILFWRQTGYFERASELNPLLHTWSLSVEEQFYLFFPLFLLLLYKFAKKRIVICIIGIGLLSMFLGIAISSSRPSAAFFLLPTRAWELATGALLALATSDRPEKPRDRLQSVAYLGLILVFYSLFAATPSTGFPNKNSVMAVLGSAMIIYAAVPGTVAARLLSHKWLVGIGLCSYSLYLWHQPILAFMRHITPYEPGALQTFAGVTLAGTLSAISWKWVERPFRDRKLISTPVLLFFVGTSAFAVLFIGIAGTIGAGFPNVSTTRSSQADLEQRLRSNKGLHEICDKEFILSDHCKTSAEPEVVVWGDSYAMHLIPGLIADDPSIKLIQMTKTACSPVVGLAGLNARDGYEMAAGCLQFNHDVINYLNGQDSIKIAVLSSPFNRLVKTSPQFISDSGVIASDKELVVKKFLETLDMLDKKGIRPLVISVTPANGMNPGDCLKKMTFLGKPLESCNFPLAESLVAQADEIAFFEEVSKTHQVVWLDRYLCDKDICAAAIQDTLIYGDRAHLSYEGSAYLGLTTKFFSKAMNDGWQDASR